jgi:hypothetical protein
MADLCALRSDNEVCIKEYVRRSISVPLRRFLVDVRRDIIQCLSVVLHGTLGSYLLDAVHEGLPNVLACTT